MQTIDAKAFEARSKNIRMIRSFGEKPWQIEIYFNEDDGSHYAKGPFGRWDAVCYIKLPSNDQKDIEEWIGKMLGDGNQ